MTSSSATPRPIRSRTQEFPHSSSRPHVVRDDVALDEMPSVERIRALFHASTAQSQVEDPNSQSELRLNFHRSYPEMSPPRRRMSRRAVQEDVSEEQDEEQMDGGTDIGRGQGDGSVQHISVQHIYDSRSRLSLSDTPIHFKLAALVTVLLLLSHLWIGFPLWTQHKSSNQAADPDPNSNLLKDLAQVIEHLKNTFPLQATDYWPQPNNLISESPDTPRSRAQILILFQDNTEGKNTAECFAEKLATEIMKTRKAVSPSLLRFQLGNNMHEISAERLKLQLEQIKQILRKPKTQSYLVDKVGDTWKHRLGKRQIVSIGGGEYLSRNSFYQLFGPEGQKESDDPKPAQDILLVTATIKNAQTVCSTLKDPQNCLKDFVTMTFAEDKPTPAQYREIYDILKQRTFYINEVSTNELVQACGANYDKNIWRSWSSLKKQLHIPTESPAQGLQPKQLRA